MNGTTHAVAGAAAGLGVAIFVESAPAATGLLIGLGTVAGLAPDLDTNGKLSNRISLHRKWLWFALASIGVIAGVYSIMALSGYFQWLGLAVALALIIFPRFLINQRFMVLLSGVSVGLSGWYLSEPWLIYFGVFMVIATFLPHRGLTHSVIGMAAFFLIARELEKSVMIDGVMLACMLGYFSHLVLDMKALPFNKKGVKWFQPFYSREF